MAKKRVLWGINFHICTWVLMHCISVQGSTVVLNDLFKRKLIYIYFITANAICLINNLALAKTQNSSD